MTQQITQAVELLKKGELVAFPTETVYGLGADASNESAVRKIFAAKGRPYDHPLIVHLAEISQLNDWAVDVSPDALRLAQAFWPGPLTLVLKKKPLVLNIVTGHQPTIGLRIPRHPVAQALLKAFGRGIAAPSANRFTHISPTTAEAVKEELGDQLMVLDGGACEVGLESTIVDMTGDAPVILRPGMITPAMIMDALNHPVKMGNRATEEIRTPGMHHLHYAPSTKTRLIKASRLSADVISLTSADLPIAILTYHPNLIQQNPTIRWQLMSNDPIQYAHDLYHTLRALDHEHFKAIWIEEVPATSEWEAIRDRIIKASGREG